MQKKILPTTTSRRTTERKRTEDNETEQRRDERVLLDRVVDRLGGLSGRPSGRPVSDPPKTPFRGPGPSGGPKCPDRDTDCIRKHKGFWRPPNRRISAFPTGPFLVARSSCLNYKNNIYFQWICMIVLLYLNLGFLDVPKTPGKPMYLLYCARRSVRMMKPRIPKPTSGPLDRSFFFWCPEVGLEFQLWGVQRSD